MTAYNPTHRNTPSTAPSAVAYLDDGFRASLADALDLFAVYMAPDAARAAVQSVAPAFGMRPEYFA